MSRCDTGLERALMLWLLLVPEAAPVDREVEAHGEVVTFAAKADAFE